MRTKIYTTASQSCNVSCLSSVDGHLGEGIGILQYLQKCNIEIDFQHGMFYIILTTKICIIR